MKKQEENILVTMTELTVHRKDKSPVFGEGVIHVRLDDEGAGPFVVLRQMKESKEEDCYSNVKMDFEELEHVVKAVKMLHDSSKKFES
jgi:hypothetical protein